MTQKTSVHRNRITIDDRTYEARVLGGGKFNVYTAGGVHVGSFQVRGRAVEVEETGVEGADPVEQIGLLWVRENLSAQPAMTPAAPEKAAISTPIAPAVPAAPVPAAPAPPKPIAPPVAQAPVAQAPVAQARPLEPSAPPPPKAEELPAAPSPSPDTIKSICRIATHARPDLNGFQSAKAYAKWLRTQPGVQGAYLSHDPESGKTVSVTIWESKEHLAAMRYAKPPSGAAQLKSLSVELLWIVG